MSLYRWPSASHWASLRSAGSSPAKSRYQRSPLCDDQAEPDLRHHCRGDAETRMDEPLSASRCHGDYARRRFIFGFVWSGLMLFSAVLNVIVALNFGVVTWASFVSIYAIVSKFGLFLTQHQYAIMRYIAVRRRPAQMVPAAV